MDEFEKSNFYVHHHVLRSNESSKDNFVSASAKRKCIAQIYHSSLSLLSNEATCQLLEENVTPYFALVDRRGDRCINNYAESALTLAANSGKSETSQWKSQLKTTKPISAIVKELTICKNHCSTWKVTQDDLQILSKMSESGVNEPARSETSKKSSSFNSNPCSSAQNGGVFKNSFNSYNNNPQIKNENCGGIQGGQVSHSKDSLVRSTSAEGKVMFSTVGGSEVGSRAIPPDFGRSDVGNRFNSRDFGKSEVGSISGLSNFGRATNGSLSTGRGGNTRVSSDIDFGVGRNGFDRGNNGIGSRSGAPDFEFNGGHDSGSSVARGGGNSFSGHYVQSTESLRQTNPPSGSRGNQRGGYNSNNNNCSGEAGMSSTSARFFRTARDELVAQNQKKHGNRGGGNSYGQPRGGAAPTYGVQKRSLGTARRAGVHGKFVPPVKPTEDDDFGGMFGVKQPQMEGEPGEEVDERLKNIDPKMVELIQNEIMDIGAPVMWEDIAGLEFAKSTIQEIVVWPLLRPDIFTGLRKPPKGLLLFGPPGTGKTLIGKCIASQSQSTFFSISASSLTSKWIGDGEKMVRALFAVAKVHQPAVVFIDEIDSLLTQRSDTEHESSRRIKTEFLVQLDGAGTGDEERILVVGATNRPQELDEAARRRLVKRLYIPLPEFHARRQIVERLMSTERCNLTDEEINEIAKLTDGYSGADMKNLCQEASLGPIRSISFTVMHQITPDQVRPVNASDFMSALQRVRASVSNRDLDAYIEWDKTYGMGSGA